MESTILVTGANGQLGSEIKEAAANSACRYIFTDVADLDITCQETVRSYLSKLKPEIIINCAAYTAVDKAETDAELAGLVNEQAPRILAQESAAIGAKLIHISTDYVFDGMAWKPYSEDAAVNPQSVYGATKLAGEQACFAGNTQSMIVRTSWLYSRHGANFVKTMIRLGKDRESLNVVSDQIGSPTWAADLAQALVAVAEKISAQPKLFVPGIYHYSNEGVCSWYDFAVKIHQLDGISCKLSPIPGSLYPTPAKRPHYSVLDKTKIKEIYGVQIPHWEASLVKCIYQLNS
jgi:dTDP-4-dehydrorhamnose reductase